MAIVYLSNFFFGVLASNFSVLDIDPYNNVGGINVGIAEKFSYRDERESKKKEEGEKKNDEFWKEHQNVQYPFKPQKDPNQSAKNNYTGKSNEKIRKK